MYLIGWKELDTWYCGVRYSRNCLPDDLWKTYFTSSKLVEEFRKIHGEPNHIEILKEFNNSKDARFFEEQKLREFDVLNKDNWLNGSIGGKSFGGSGYFSEEHKKKLSKARRKRKWTVRHSDEAKIRIGIASKNRKRKPHSIETRQKMSKPRSPEGRLNIAKGNIGKRKKLSIESVHIEQS